MKIFDELRFGPQRTLNLREGLPTAAEAVRRAENWIREQQMHGTNEVLVITGRGNQSIGGVAVLRGAVEKLLFSLRRRGVVTSHGDHNPGAFVVKLAPIKSLVDAPSRRREPARLLAPAVTIHGLTVATTTLLRDLAERSLVALGVTPTDDNVGDEMHRHLRALAPALSGGEGMETQLRAALRAAIAEYD